MYGWFLGMQFERGAEFFSIYGLQSNLAGLNTSRKDSTEPTLWISLV